MLVTLSWWQFFDVSDIISILVTPFGCWCPTLMFKDRGSWWKKRIKLSPTSQSCPQHILSPTSVTNIDVAKNNNLSIFIAHCKSSYFHNENIYTVYLKSVPTEFVSSSDDNWRNICSSVGWLNEYPPKYLKSFFIFSSTPNTGPRLVSLPPSVRWNVTDAQNCEPHTRRALDGNFRLRVDWSSEWYFRSAWISILNPQPYFDFK